MTLHLAPLILVIMMATLNQRLGVDFVLLEYI